MKSTPNDSTSKSSATLIAFPPTSCFNFSPVEFAGLKSQLATSSWGGKRKLPNAFTEYGAIMAAGVLNSKRAVEMSVYVVRAFV
jgi:hypothetical protein